MKQLTVKNLTIQFDGEGENPLEEVQKVLDLINETLSNAQLECQPQILVSAIDNSDISVESPLPYSVKSWESKEKFDAGDAETVSEEVNIQEAISDAKTALAMGAYHVEIFETESGDTFFHSNDGSIDDLD